LYFGATHQSSTCGETSTYRFSYSHICIDPCRISIHSTQIPTPSPIAANSSCDGDCIARAPFIQSIHSLSCLLCLVHDTGNTDATFQATAQLSHSIPTNHAGVSHVRSIQSESSLGAVTVRMMMIALEWIEFVRHFPFSSSPISGSA